MLNKNVLKQNQKIKEKLNRKYTNIKNNLDSSLQEKEYNNYNNLFKLALENDLNTSNAITVLYDVIKDENINNKTKYELIKSFDQDLSLNLLEDNTKKIDDNINEYILSKIEERNQAKANKDYALADSIRDELLEKNSREGTTYEIL